MNTNWIFCCPFCNRKSFMTAHDIGWDIDPSGEENQHADFCKCGAWRFRIERLEYNGKRKIYLGKWTKEAFLL